MSTPGTRTAQGAVVEERPSRDRLLDVIRSVAIARVVMWHTWSWWWLSWIPAMPAMFFTTGALLGSSVERHGWWSTARSRLRRLLLPFWVYGACAVTVMLAGGWRPGPAELLAWVLPLSDPSGPLDLAGLWIPLWYVRAYLWFLLAGAVLWAVVRRLGWWSALVASLAAAALWAAHESGTDVPPELGDAVVYLPFVLAGMAYLRSPRLPSALALGGGSVAVLAGAAWSWSRFGPDDGVVNRSYLLVLLVGAAGVAAALALAGPIRRLGPVPSRIVEVINRRALTIYLWQGFGLVAADRLVDGRVGVLWEAVASMLVVVIVIAGAVLVVGPVEDRAARRTVTSRRGAGSTPRGRVVVVLAAALIAAALVVSPVPGEVPDLPLSGRAVLGRAGLITDSLGDGGAARDTASQAGRSPTAVLDDWVAEHAGLLDRLGTSTVEIALVGPSGELEELTWSGGSTFDEPTFPWWSVTKTITASWLAESAVDGIVSLDDPLSRWVPESPHAERITLGQLARHLSGIPTSIESPLFEASPDRDVGSWFDSGELAADPGEEFQYSRIGYHLLALALERATGTTWTDHVRDLADGAGADVGLDEPEEAGSAVTDPDGHGYRGGLWAAGGIVSSTSDAAVLWHWLFSEHLDPEAVRLMTDFSADEDRRFYGLGLVPLCPCELDGDSVVASAFGLDSATSSVAVHAASGATVVLRPDSWWEDDAPQPDFYDLQVRLLDAVSG